MVIIITGVVDKKGIAPSSIYHKNIQGVELDKFNRRIHTKLFVIDEQISITGSLNPSIKGVKYNDESILVIQNNEIAQFFQDYINYIATYRRILS